MSRATKTHLSGMMFLQYAVGGFFLPIISHYLKNHLGFGAFQVGAILAAQSIAAMVAPFVVAYLADRRISAERLLGLCHALAGVVMLVLARQSRFGPFLCLYFLYGLLFVPTFALTNAVAFHHLPDAQREFGRIRMWGPASWVVVACSFSFLWLRSDGMLNSRLPHALIFAAAASIVLALYAITLPPGITKADRKPTLADSSALRLFLRPSLVVLCTLMFFNALVHQLYYYGMSPFLSEVGLTDKFIMPVMSLGQFGEIIMLATLGFFLPKLGVKRALLIGALAQGARCLVFAYGNPLAIIAVIPSHGICYAYFFTVAFIYLDLHSTRLTRAGAQQLFNILVSGLGPFAGNLLAGEVAKTFVLPGTTLTDFRTFWLVSVGMAVAIAAGIALFFREEPPPQNPEPETRNVKPNTGG